MGRAALKSIFFSFFSFLFAKKGSLFLTCVLINESRLPPSLSSNRRHTLQNRHEEKEEERERKKKREKKRGDKRKRRRKTNDTLALSHFPSHLPTLLF